MRAPIILQIAALRLFRAKAGYALFETPASNRHLIFDPSYLTINEGHNFHFVTSMLPPHNIIVEGRADLSRESLMFSPGESQDILFADAGDYNFFCGPHQGAGMTGTIHVN